MIVLVEKSMGNKDNTQKIDPTVKEVLSLLGMGAVLAGSFIMPGLGKLVDMYHKQRIKEDQEQWRKFNLWRLRQVIKRLDRQKAVEIKGGLVRITDKGRQKSLKFNLEEIKLKERRDGHWRIVIYDISNLKKFQRELLRTTLKRLKFFPLQKSVYLTPFICEDEIEYLRQIFHISSEVIVLKLSSLENEDAYRDYFGI